MCFTKLTHYNQSGHWARSVTLCDNQRRSQRCRMVFRPDVECHAQCPDCAASADGLVYLQAIICDVAEGSLHEEQLLALLNTTSTAGEGVTDPEDYGLPASQAFIIVRGYSQNKSKKVNGRNVHHQSGSSLRKQDRDQNKMAEADKQGQIDREDYNKKDTERCRMGTRRELSHPTDDREQQLCWYHKYAQGEDQCEAACLR